jgi:hypothetical protein
MHTKQQIEQWVRESGIDTALGYRGDDTPENYFEAWPEQLARFAELVAADERERCAALCDELARPGAYTVAGSPGIADVATAIRNSAPAAGEDV